MERIKGLERGLEVLAAMVDLRSATVKDVAKHTGFSSQAVYRFLESLQHAGFVHRNTYREPYRITGHLRQLSHGVKTETLVMDAARPLMADMTERTGWPALLGVVEGIEARVLETTDHLSRHNLKRYSHGDKMPQFLRPTGAVHRAFCDPAEARRIHRNTLAQHRDEIFVKDEELGGELLKRVQRQGYVIFEPLRSPEGSVGVPLLFANGTIYGLELRFVTAAVENRSIKTDFIPRLQSIARSVIATVELQTQGKR